MPLHPAGAFILLPRRATVLMPLDPPYQPVAVSIHLQFCVPVLLHSRYITRSSQGPTFDSRKELTCGKHAETKPTLHGPVRIPTPQSAKGGGITAANTKFLAHPIVVEGLTLPPFFKTSTSHCYTQREPAAAFCTLLSFFKSAPAFF